MIDGFAAASTMTERTYHVGFTSEAERDVERLDPPIRRRILARLDWLSANAKGVQHQSLASPLASLYKPRAGDYRILYDVFHDQRIILVHAVGHRRDIYR